MVTKEEHFSRLRKYYLFSWYGYTFLLQGTKHFGYHPKERNVTQRQAGVLMQEQVAKALQLEKGMRVLDAGCGEGVVSVYLAKEYDCRIDGITVVPFEAKAAKRRAKKESVSNLTEFQIMDYENLTFPARTFDCVFTLETLVHARNAESALRNLYKVLKKDGKIALFEYMLASEEEWEKDEERISEAIASGSAMASILNFRPGKVEEFLRKTGFKNVRRKDITENVMPTAQWFRKIAYCPYLIVRLFRLQRWFPNVTAGVEVCNLAEKRLYKYCIYTAEK